VYVGRHATTSSQAFTRTEVEQMLEAGFCGQRFELIDGDLIDKMGRTLLIRCASTSSRLPRKDLWVERIQFNSRSARPPSGSGVYLSRTLVLAELKGDYGKRIRAAMSCCLRSRWRTPRRDTTRH